MMMNELDHIGLPLYHAQIHFEKKESLAHGLLLKYFIYKYNQ